MGIDLGILRHHSGDGFGVQSGEKKNIEIFGGTGGWNDFGRRRFRVLGGGSGSFLRQLGFVLFNDFLEFLQRPVIYVGTILYLKV